MLTPEQTKKIEGISDPLIKQKYIKYFQLPEDLRQSIFAVETADKIGKIGAENKLNPEQISSLAYAVGGVLLGDIKITIFVRAVEEKCKIDTPLAQKIARQVAQEIFLPVKESLKKIHQGMEISEKELPPKQPLFPPSPPQKPPTISQPAPPQFKSDTYKEPVSHEDIAGPPGAKKVVEPRINGNIVDLSHHESNHESNTNNP